jgi:hypothetical protein
MPGPSWWMEQFLAISPPPPRVIVYLFLPLYIAESILPYPLAKVVDGSLEPFSELGS